MTAYVQPDLEVRKPIYEAIVGLAPLPAVKKLSRKDRKEMEGATGDNFRFAPVDISVISHVLHIIQSEYSPIPEESVFVDLGSGVGHAVFAAALLAPFRQCLACEQLPSLSAKTKELEEKYYSIMDSRTVAEGGDPIPEELKKAEITRVEGDMIAKLDEILVKGVKVIFCAATCMDDSVLNAICEKALEPNENGEDKVAPETFFVTLSKMIPPQHLNKWDVIVAEEITCAWGKTSLFIHQKKFEDAGPEPVAG
jgi:hypothetical protein